MLSAVPWIVSFVYWTLTAVVFYFSFTERERDLKSY